MVLLFGGFVVGWPATAEFLAIDACLDAGGSFNYAQSVCDFRTSHPYSPTILRSPWLILLGGAMFVSGAAAILQRGRTRE